MGHDARLRVSDTSSRRDVVDLRQHLIDNWNSLSESTVDAATDDERRKISGLCG